MKKVLLTASALAFGLGLNAQSYFFENFSGGLGQFSTVDGDGDGRNWAIADYGTAEGAVASSESWYNNNGTGVVLNPDNWMISSAIDLTSASGDVDLEWKVYAQDQDWEQEFYTVYVSTGNTVNDFTGTTPVFSETLTTSAGYMSRSVDMTPYIGQTVYLAIRHHNSSDWFRINIDDVEVRTVHPHDVRLDVVDADQFVTPGSNITIAGTVTNRGTNNITALDITYNDGTGAVTDNLTGLNIAPGATYDFTHGTPFNVANATTYNLDVSVDIPSQTDGFMADNSLTHTVAGLAFTADRKVVIEEGTGTWCGYCPRGAVAMEAMENDASRSKFIGIAVHNNDPMMVQAYDQGANFGGWPSMNVNRSILDAGVSTQSMQSAYDAEVNKITNCNVDINITSYNGSTGAWTADVDVTWAADVSTDHRVAIVVVEDEVTGTSGGYGQTNYFHGGSEGPLSGAGIADWTTAGDPVPAANMVYDHVGRELIGGYNGAPGSLTIPATANSTETYGATGTLNAAWDDDHVHLVAMVINNTNGEIMNAASSAPLAVGIEEEASSVNFFSIYPNPANNNANIAFELNETANVKVSVLNIAGQTVYAESLGNVNGSHILNLNANELANGMYFVNLTANGQVITKKLNIQK